MEKYMKIIGNLLAVFIPTKDLRHKVRAYFKRNVIDSMEDISAKIDNTNIKISNIINKIDWIQSLLSKKFSNENFCYVKDIKGQIFYFQDSITSTSVDSISDELNSKREEYNYDNINFKEGDVVIDIGGNVGMVSIYLAKKFPFLKIYAFEPVKEDYENFLQNMKLNNIPNETITVENKAVTCDGRAVNMNINLQNKGGSFVLRDPNGNLNDFKNIKFDNLETNNISINSIKLEEICKKYGIKKIKLLKIDCEGSEYEILYNLSKEVFSNILTIRGEFHSKNDKKIIELEEYCRQNMALGGDICVDHNCE